MQAQPSSQQEVTLDWQPYEGKFKKMSKDQLIAFMQERGNTLKVQVCHEAQYETLDKEQMDLMCNQLRDQMELKRKKIDFLDKQKVKYETEINATDIAVKALGEKLKKRKEQYHSSDLVVRKQKEELRRISKEIKPKTTKQFYEAATKSRVNEKVKILVDSFIGVLANKETATREDIDAYLKKHEEMFNKMNEAEPVKVSDALADRHFEAVKAITKSFFDNTSEHFKECAPMAPFVAWTTQYIILIKHAKEQLKVISNQKNVEKEIAEKNLKKKQLESIVKAFAEEQPHEYLRAEMVEDEKRYEQYLQLRAYETEHCVDAQKQYVGFEKQYFSELEQFVIRKKMAKAMKK